MLTQESQIQETKWKIIKLFYISYCHHASGLTTLGTRFEYAYVLAWTAETAWHVIKLPKILLEICQSCKEHLEGIKTLVVSVSHSQSVFGLAHTLSLKKKKANMLIL